MTKQTREIISKLIREYMRDNGIVFTDPNPFPVSFKTIWLILDAQKRDINRTFTTRTQKKLIHFFKLDHVQDGHDLKILDK